MLGGGEISISGSHHYRIRTNNKGLLEVEKVQYKNRGVRIESSTTLAAPGMIKLESESGYDWWVLFTNNPPSANKRRFVDEATFTSFA